jgi:hypothetical protein
MTADRAERERADAVRMCGELTAERDGYRNQLDADWQARQIRDLTAAVGRAHAECDEARAALGRVRDLHVEHTCCERPCPDCLGMGPICAECGHDYPCRSIAALDGSGT